MEDGGRELGEGRSKQVTEDIPPSKCYKLQEKASMSPNLLLLTGHKVTIPIKMNRPLGGVLLYALVRYLYTLMKVKNLFQGTSLVAQWLRIRLPMQGTRVQALVREDPTCHGATKPACHSY